MDALRAAPLFAFQFLSVLFQFLNMLHFSNAILVEKMSNYSMCFFRINFELTRKLNSEDIGLFIFLPIKENDDAHTDEQLLCK